MKIRATFACALGFGVVAFADTASLRMQNSQYFSNAATYYRDDAAATNTSLSVRLQREKRVFQGLHSTVDLKDEYSATENWNYLNVYQAHVRFKARDMHVHVGRKLETWSAADEEWRQGIFQPRYMQNRLKSEAAGLVGVFASRPAGGLLVTGALVPVHVPDLGPRFTVENDKFTSKNPWFDPPAASYKFRGAEGDIHYSVDKPELEDIALNPGAVVKVENSGASVSQRLSLAYKPVSQLLLGFPSLNKVVVGSEGSYLDVAVTPRVIYHWVAGMDMWTQQRGWTVSASVIHDRPNADRLPEGWTSQSYSPAWIYSVSASRALEAEGPAAARLKLGMFKVDGGFARDRGVFASDRTLFEGRFQYLEAYMAGVLWPVRRVFKNALETEARVVFDRVQNGGVVLLSTGYNFTREWRLEAEADVLGLTGSRAQYDEGFLSIYRANDRFGLGMTYVF